MRIAIVAHNCRAGGGLFGTLNLIKAFKNVAGVDKLLLIYSQGYGYEQLDLPDGSDRFCYRGGHNPIERLWFEEVGLPRLLKRYHPDVIFGMGNTGVSKPTVPQALFIRQAYLFYDSKKYFPDLPLSLRLRLGILKWQIKRSLPATGMIFCQTPVVLRRFSESFGYPEDKMRVLRLPSPVEIKADPSRPAPALFDTESHTFHILLLSRYLPHRNPKVLISLCRKYAHEFRDRRIKFIVTLEKGHGPSEKFMDNVRRNQFDDVIINAGEIPRRDVPLFYANSRVLWLPTMLETLGFPFLEAMKMGIPILVPDLDFARYVCGSAALFYDPWNMDSLYAQMVRLYEDASLRQKLVEAGYAQLQDQTRFAENWDEAAADILRELRNMIRFSG